MAQLYDLCIDCIIGLKCNKESKRVIHFPDNVPCLSIERLERVIRGKCMLQNKNEFNVKTIANSNEANGKAYCCPACLGGSCKQTGYSRVGVHHFINIWHLPAEVRLPSLTQWAYICRIIKAKYTYKNMAIPEMIEKFIHAEQVSRYRKENPLEIEISDEQRIKQEKIAIAKEERQKFFKENQRVPTMQEMREIDKRILARINELFPEDVRPPKVETDFSKEKEAIRREEQQKFFKEHQRMPTMDEMREIDERITARINELFSGAGSSNEETDFGIEQRAIKRRQVQQNFFKKNNRMPTMDEMREIDKNILEKWDKLLQDIRDLSEIVLL